MKNTRNRKFLLLASMLTVVLLTAAPAFAQTAVCGTSILNSPWNYNGTPGTYTTSGTPAGLPTFGEAGTNFPDATSVLVVAAGNNTTAAENGSYQLNNTVIYFEPGTHNIDGGMYTGNNSAYVGGYTSAAGKAIIDGGGNNGLDAADTKVANDTYEYLTIQNYSSGQNGAVLGNVNGSSFATGNTYMYNTIGPNEYSYNSGELNTTSNPGLGGGYAIMLDGNTTISYNCITKNAQGGYNGFGLNNVVTNNEISWNGLGEYPDTGGTGASPYACGCSGGGKMFFTVNATMTGNYVHDNYNVGIWFDFDNTGMTITNNYIASNWGSGIMIEAGYNAKVADNILVGNGWASDGAWPAGYEGGTCYGGISCTNGNGPVTGDGGGNPIGDIDLSDTGANANLSTIQVPNGKYTVPGCSSNCSVTSNWSGQLLIEGNTFTNSFGGVKVYTDTNRYPGNIDNDSTCSTPLGALQQANSSLYYFQTDELVTNSSDAVVSGSTVTTSAGTTEVCNNYGQTGSEEGSGGNFILGNGTVQAPSVGMGVFDINSGKFLGNVASVTSANQFTLNQSPGNESDGYLMVAAYGGCGPADDFGGAPGVKSGNPAEYYFDNCVWGGRGTTISGNVQTVNGTTVTGCTVANGCGFNQAIAFNAGVPTLVQFFDDYTNIVADASGGLGNVYSDNTYTWTGDGSGFQWKVGNQNNSPVTQATWQASPYGQDTGSTFGTVTTPIISLTPGSLAFTATAGGSNPAAQNITVSNSGGGTLASPTTTITYNNGSGWLTVTTQGSSAPYTLSNQPSISGLAAGTYTATISVASSGATNSPQTYLAVVTVYYSAPTSPAIDLSPTSLNFNAMVGGANPSSQNVTVSNSGGGTLASPTTTINYSQGSGWLSVNCTGSSAPYTCSTQPATGSLAAGTYNATVSVASTGASNTPQSYTVAFTVNAATPIISLSPTSLTFNATAGGGNPASQNVTESNSGGGTLASPTTTINYGSGSGWLTVTTQGSSAPYTLVTQAVTGSLAAGTYTATVSVTSTGASNTPQTYSVTFIVAASGGGGSTQENLSSYFNEIGMYTDGQTFSSSGGLGGGQAYSATLLGSSLSWNSQTFNFGTANASNVVEGLGQVITLPSGQYSTLQMLAAASGGNMTSQTITVTYTDLTTSTFTQSFSNWYASQGYSGESIAKAMAYHDIYTGATNGQAVDLYGYSFAINNAKTVKSITLPSLGANALQVLAITLAGEVTPTISLSPTSLTFNATVGGSNPASQNVTVSNSGGGTLASPTTTINYGSGSGWLTVTTQGSSSPYTLVTQPATGSLAAGTYTATVSVASSGATNTPQTYSVTFTVTAAPTISLSPTSLTFNATAGGSNPAAQDVTVSNSGGGTLASPTTTINYGSGSGWLTVTKQGSSAPYTLVTQPATGSLAAGTYTATVSVASSGATNTPQTYSVTFTVAAAGGGSTQVNLSSAFNRAGMYTDGTTFSSTGGLDGSGNAYSATLLGSSLSWNSQTFNFGTANAMNDVEGLGQTITLPSGQYSTLQILAAATGGNMTSQTITVTYTDNSTSTFTQSFSNWWASQGYSGESIAKSMSYIDTYSGGRTTGTFYLYGYSFAINNAKTVKSITLPSLGANALEVVAITLAGQVSGPQQVSLSSYFNEIGMYTDGQTFSSSGGLGGGQAYSATLLGSSLSWNSQTFNFGTANASNVVEGLGQVITLPSGQYSTLQMLAAASGGNMTSQTITVTYTDLTTSTFTQSFSNWYASQGYSGESIAKAMAYHDIYTGATNGQAVDLYGYSFAINNAKTVKSITLPSLGAEALQVLAITLVP